MVAGQRPRGEESERERLIRTGMITPFADKTESEQLAVSGTTLAGGRSNVDVVRERRQMEQRRKERERDRTPGPEDLEIVVEEGGQVHRRFTEKGRAKRKNKTNHPRAELVAGKSRAKVTPHPLGKIVEPLRQAKYQSLLIMAISVHRG